MHGCSSPPVLLVSARFGSMGGVVEGGVGVADKTSPRRAAIEKVQAELRREYDYREKRKRELEFLENGGDPLEFFKDRNASTVSVQSTSFTDQHPDQILTSEAKGSFALTASPHGDSVESSGRLGANPCEPNSADNLMLFGAEHEYFEGNRNSLHPKRSNIVGSEALSHLDGNERTRKHGDSAALGLPRKAYKRRNRSRPNRDGTRSSSTDVNPAGGSLASSLPSHHCPTEVGEVVTDAEMQNISLISNSKPTSPVEGTLHKTVLADIRETTMLTGGKTVESAVESAEYMDGGVTMDAVTSETALAEQSNHQSHSCAVKTPVQPISDKTETIHAMEERTSAVIECEPSGAAAEVENLPSSDEMNGFGSQNGEQEKNDDNKTAISHGIKRLDSEFSYTQANLSINENETEMCTKLKNSDSSGKSKDQLSVPVGMKVVEGDDLIEEKKKTDVVDSCSVVNMESSSACEVLNPRGPALQNEVKGQSISSGLGACEPTELKSGQEPSDILGDNPGTQNENSCNVGTVPLDAHTSSGSDSKLERKIDEDSVLKEAQIIEEKRKRIAELSVVTSPKQLRPKSHWDYVLEEMAWLANDFAQERVWKLSAAAQISKRAAFTCQLRKQEKSYDLEAKIVASNLSKSIMNFWHSVVENHDVRDQKSQKGGALRAYAAEFMKYNNTNAVHQAEGPQTPDRLGDMEIHDLSWEGILTEENLFYRVPPGALEIYRNSVESLAFECEKIGSSILEEVETSACDAAADIESQDYNAYDEDQGETGTYDMPMPFEVIKSSRISQKKRKHLAHAYRVRSCEVNSDILAMQYAENKALAQQSVLAAKRPAGSLNVSIPTKRVRTASRRVVSPFGAGTSGCVQMPNKTDASSGDTSSFQDDQGTFHGGSFVPNSLEVQSIGEFEKQLQFDSTEVSTKHKKKKKAKHLNVAYEPRWQVDSSYQNEQKDHLKKSHQLDANGSHGLFGQPMLKKPKTMRQSLDSSFENITPVGASIPSPVASQVSNNPNQFIKILGGRDRSRKPKAVKMLAGHPSSGTLWTLFEDQALVVLAHDLGPNWYLVSDAINSTMKFKCISRKAMECKERHNYLMDRTSGDGADSAEDSGSSQPYPCSLPGIPQGSARQLFQRLQGPMEEDTIKSHFEKIIMIGQKQHRCKTQDPKQLQQPHGSHAIALSVACPNSLNGPPVFNPLELCDAMTSSELIDYEGPSSGGFVFPNQGAATPMNPASGASSMLQGSANNFSSAPGSLDPSIRDGRYGVRRPTSLSADEQHRMQQYNQIMSCRNTPQPTISAPGALPGNNHGVGLLASGNGMGLTCAVNRNMSAARNGFQGMGASSIVNSGGMVSPGFPSANMHSGVGSGQGKPMLRPRQALHIMRPGSSQDSPTQMDLHMQVPPRISQGASHFGGLNPPFPNPSASPPVSSYTGNQASHPMSPQQPQVLSPHHTHIQGPASPAASSMQAYAIRLAKERQQQHYLQQQQQLQQQQLQQPQFSPPSSSMPHVQSPSQPPVSSPLQNSSHVQPQTGSPPVPLSPLATASSMNSMPQHQQKHQTPSQGIVRNAQSGGNLGNKQRQRQQQQFSQANRQHPQVRQQPQGQPLAKAAGKVVGRGNPMVHQNTSTDSSLMNGVPTSPGFMEKGEAAQQQSLYAGSVQNAAQSTKQYVSPQSSNQLMSQQKVYTGQTPSSAKHQHQPNSHSDNSSHGHVPPVAPGLSASHQSSSLGMAGPNQQQASPQPKVNLKRVVQSNRRINSDPTKKSQSRDSECDQRPTCSSADTDTMTTLPQATKNATNTSHVSPGSAYHWHASKPLSDSNPLNSATNLNSLESIPSNTNELAPHAGQGPSQRSPPASLSSIRHNASIQWQQQQPQPSELQQPNSLVPKTQQQPQPLPPLHSQQQEQLLQAGNGNMYGRNADSRLE